MRTLAAALTLLLFFAAAAYGAQAPDYVKNPLTLPGRLLSLAAGDIDGDGLGDIAAFCLEEEAGKPARRSVSVFYQRQGGRLPARPDQSWRLAPTAVVCDVGPVSAGGGAGAGIGFIAPDGVYAYVPEGRRFDERPRLLVKAESLFTRPDPKDIPRWPFLAGTGRAGGAALLVPGTYALGVYAGRPGGYERTNLMPLDCRTGFRRGAERGDGGSLTVSHRVPVVEVLGFDGPRGRDVLAAWDDNADAWLMRADGTYPDEPDVSFRPGLFDASPDDPMESAWVLPVDLDGDGACDMAVTKKTGGLAHAKSLIFVFMQRGKGAFPKKPDSTIITEGVVGPRFVDFDGDGRRDILVPSVKLGVSNFINMLASKQVNVELAIYLQDGKGRYPDRPTKQKAVKFMLDISSLGKKVAPVLEVGKFTKTPGYGLLVVSGEDEVSVYLPDKYSVFGDRPGLRLEVDAPTGVEVADLNGDGIDDLVMSYMGDDKRGDRLNVFLSK